MNVRGKGNGGVRLPSNETLQSMVIVFSKRELLQLSLPFFGVHEQDITESD